MREIIQKALEAADDGDLALAWQLLVDQQAHLGENRDLALAWLDVAGRNRSEPPERERALETIVAAWPQDAVLINAACDQLLRPIDGRAADDPVESKGDPATIAVTAQRRCLEHLSDVDRRDPQIAGYAFNTLGNAYRLAGPAHDQEAEAAYQAALELSPGETAWRFNLGLLYKHRARFEDGFRLYRTLFERGSRDEAVLWNLAICATGAGEGETAAAVWRALDIEATLGDDGLPQADGLGQVKLRLSTGPVGSPDQGRPDNDYEHVWAAPVSPCHGTVLNPTLLPVGADMGDLVLWDGSPVGVARLGEEEVPRFAALAVLRRGDTRTFQFIATLPASDAQWLRDRLPTGCSMYVFDEQVRLVCADCIKGGGEDPSPHEHAPTERQRIEGKLVVTAAGSPAELQARLEAAITTEQTVEMAIPELHRDLGDDARAARDDELARRLREIG